MLTQDYEIDTAPPGTRAPARVLAGEDAETGRFFAASGALLAVADFDGYFRDLSPAWEDLLGHSREELLATPYAERIHPDDRDRTLLEMKRLAIETGTTVFESRFLHRDGTPRWLEWTARGEAQRGLIYAAATDVTERKKVEAEREALQRKLEENSLELERYTQTLFSDLKSPLLTVRGFLGFIEKNAVEGNHDQLRADLGRIAEAVDRMKLFLDELLELTKIGRIINAPEGVALAELVHEAAARIEGPLRDSGATLHVEPALPKVCGDRARLLDLFEHLLDNAVKFLGDAREPRIEVGADEKDGEVRCWVRDNGLGVDPRFHERIFALFEQLEASASGSGIGLAVAKRIVAAHGGRIWVESDGRGQGSCFYFTFPA